MSIPVVLANTLIYTVPFALMFSALIISHELGHLFAARAVGVRATNFAVGFGPVLWRHLDRRGCSWEIRFIPFGGFVQLPTTARTGTGRRLDTISPLSKAFILLAGPAVNIAIGLVLLGSLYTFNGRVIAEPVVGMVIAGSPAATAGVEPGDRVTAVNGRPITTFTQMISEISIYPGGPVTLTVQRSGHIGDLDFSMTAQAVKVEQFGVEQSVGRIGVNSNGAYRLEQVDPATALWSGTLDVVELSRNILVSTGQILNGSRSLGEMGGPVKMAEMSGNAVQIGLGAFIFLVAAISINLGILNLFPLPILDGGQLIICAVEAIIRRPVSPRVLYYVHTAGGLFLLSLMIGVTVNDLFGLFWQPNT